MSAWPELVTPPEWSEWSWFQRVIYLTAFAFQMALYVTAMTGLHTLMYRSA